MRSTQRLLRSLALGYVPEKNGDLSFLWFSDAESRNVIPAVQLCCMVFKVCGFARQGYLAVNFEPVLFVQGGNLAHSSAPRVLNPRLFLKRRIDFQKAVINRLIVSVEQHFDGTNAFVNGIEQRVVFFFRLAQLFLRPLAL